MNIRRAIRTFRRYVGLEPASFVDYTAPVVGIFAFGLIAGAAVGLLFAPMPGDRLRDQVKGKLSGYRSRLLPEGMSERIESYTNRINAEAPRSFPRT